MIDRKEIDRAFDLCLGRPVESEATYRHFTGLDSLHGLYSGIFASLEFRGRLPAAAPIGIAPLEIETEASLEALARMVDRIEATWSRLGETDPHWSVVTDQRFKKEYLDANRDDYQRSGHVDYMLVEEAAARAGFDLSRYQTCFELGCGTGRVTEWLARRFTRVVAADISQTHLEVAKTALASVPNASFIKLARIDEIAALPRFDFLYTRIVLQHNPPPVIAAILRRLLAALDPGGAAYVQLPVWINDYKFRVADYLGSTSNGLMEVHAFPQRELLAIIQDGGCRIRELREDAMGPQFSGISNTMLLEKSM